MKYEEIDPTDIAVIDIITEHADAAKRAERDRKAREKIAQANRKKAEASRQYQDKLRAANDRQRDACAALSKPLQ